MLQPKMKTIKFKVYKEKNFFVWIKNTPASNLSTSEIKPSSSQLILGEKQKIETQPLQQSNPLRRILNTTQKCKKSPTNLQPSENNKKSDKIGNFLKKTDSRYVQEKEQNPFKVKQEKNQQTNVSSFKPYHNI